MRDDASGRQPDTRDRADNLRKLGAVFRQLAATELSDRDIHDLGVAVMKMFRGVDLPAQPTNVQQLPIRPGPASESRRLALSLESFAARVEQEADAIDERLDQLGADRERT